MHSFLQSRAWEELQRQEKRHVWRIRDMLIIRHPTLLGAYLYAPHPHFRDEAHERLFFQDVSVHARREGALFLRIDPFDELRTKPQYQLVPAPALQPSHTVIIPLNRTDAELLSAMHPKMRYNIRLAARAGVVVREEDASDNNLTLFFELLARTARRNHFSLHPHNYYKALARTQNEEFANRLFFAYWRDMPLAAALINFYTPSQRATYLHGASSGEERQLMAPHLLHWEIMGCARARGFHFYDLWGTDEQRWPGLTRFKKSFGGEVKTYPQSVNIIYRPLRFRIYQNARALVQKIHGASSLFH
ncbi:MAG: Methicillin resistance protein [Parcubacteria group bacterium Gr01-1014_66]|nr:MAG: Methicillin resistance protein [Parcubacteria group bacterium Gr01-1014_66]